MAQGIWGCQLACLVPWWPFQRELSSPPLHSPSARSHHPRLSFAVLTQCLSETLAWLSSFSSSHALDQQSCVNHTVSHIFTCATACFLVIQRRLLDYQLVDFKPRLSRRSSHLCCSCLCIRIDPPRLPGGQLATAGALSLKRPLRLLSFKYFLQP